MKEATLYLFFVGSLLCFNSKAQEVITPGKFSTITPSEKAIKSMLPPQLSYPANESVIDIKYPVLIWAPPRPINGMMVTYNLRLVEILKGQTLAEALLQNPAMVNLSGLSNTFLNYPADATPLHMDGHYAWQVAASYGVQSLGVTDMWSFTVKNKEEKKDDDIEYPVAEKVSKARFYVTHGVFHFVYNNKANEKVLSYTIKSMDNSVANMKELPPIELQPGMNKLDIDLKQRKELKNNTYYYLEIKDSRRQVYKLMYYYVKT